MGKLRLIGIVIVQNPRIWIPLVLMPVFQLLKIWGICSIEQAVLDQTADLLSIISGGVATIMGLITEFKTKAQKREEQPPAAAPPERKDSP